MVPAWIARERIRSLRVGGFLMALALTGASCGSNSTTTPTAPAATVTTTLNGNIPAPVSGAAAPVAVVTFSSAAAGTGLVTLSSAIETLSNGTPNSAVVVGISLGTPSGDNCVLPAGTTPTLISAGATQYQATYVAGMNCFALTSGDQSVQAGPVAFTLVVVAF